MSVSDGANAIELEIFAEPNPPKRVSRPEACGLRHLAFRVDDVEATVEELAQMGIAPDVAQCAFRIGDSSTNAITPFLFYMPLVLTYMRQYDKQITYGSLLKYTWRYSLGILVAWTLMFIVWYLLKIPMGL